MAIKVGQDRKNKITTKRNTVVSMAMMGNTILIERLGMRGKDDPKIRKELDRRGVAIPEKEGTGL